MHDLACVVHLHSLYSDGTGTVPEIARAARRAGADVVLLTDHDTLEAKRRGEEGWYGDVLAAGRRGGLAAPAQPLPRVRHSTSRSTTRASTAPGSAGRFGTPAASGSPPTPSRRARARFERAGRRDAVRRRSTARRSTASSSGASSTTRPSASQSIAGPAALRARCRPGARPPARAQPARLGRAVPHAARGRRIGGLDAHQFGKRDRPVRAAAADGLPALVPLHPHPRALRARRPTRELEHDREQVYGALREGRCYIAVDAVAPARGFAFEADDLPMGAEAPAGRRTLRARARARRACGCCATATRSPAPRATRARARGRGAGRLPRGGAAPRARARAHLDPVEPDLPALSRANGVLTPYRDGLGPCAIHHMARYLCPNCHGVVDAAASRFAFCGACGGPLTTENIVPVQLIRTGERIPPPPAATPETSTGSVP